MTAEFLIGRFSHTQVVSFIPSFWSIQLVPIVIRPQSLLSTLGVMATKIGTISRILSTIQITGHIWHSFSFVTTASLKIHQSPMKHWYTSLHGSMKKKYAVFWSQHFQTSSLWLMVLFFFVGSLLVCSGFIFAASIGILQLVFFCSKSNGWYFFHLDINISRH